MFPEDLGCYLCSRVFPKIGNEIPVGKKKVAPCEVARLLAVWFNSALNGNAHTDHILNEFTNEMENLLLVIRNTPFFRPTDARSAIYGTCCRLLKYDLDLARRLLPVQ